MRCNIATKVLKALEEMVTSLSIKKCLVRSYLGANKRVCIYKTGRLALKRSELKNLVIMLDDCLFI